MSVRKGVALVTGAARGIGRNIALRLARDGYDIAVNDLPRTTEALAVCGEIRNLGRKSCVVSGDISIEEDVQDIIKGTVEQLGSLNVVCSHHPPHLYPIPTERSRWSPMLVWLLWIE